MESDLLEEMNERVVKNFLDMLILMELKEGRPMSGYDFISFIHKKFNLLISSGTVYSQLYYLERNGLIEGKLVQRKRVYVLADKGKETVKAFLHLKEKILGLMLNLFIGK